jgi:hypothetical protein
VLESAATPSLYPGGVPVTSHSSAVVYLRSMNSFLIEARRGICSNEV